jgi:glycosyltransferase involved in cell wall biosynthesis
MRILHVWDQAGVAFVLAKYQRLRGHDSKAIMVKEYDKYGIAAFYSNFVVQATLENFVQKSIDEALCADILHVHGRNDMVLRFRNEFKNSKKIILHYHGTDLRGIRKQKLPHRSRISDLAVRAIFTYRNIRNNILIRKRLHSQAQTLADAVIVSTPDLISLANKAIYLPNPIDTDHFRPDKIHSQHKNPRALTMETEATDARLTLEQSRKYNADLHIDVYDRIKSPIMYSDMPAFLKKYELYVDIRYVDGKLLENLSKTGFEALACGLDVLDYRLKRLRDLPEENKADDVTSRLLDIYSQ